jgi:hypothetical protein
MGGIQPVRLKLLLVALSTLLAAFGFGGVAMAAPCVTLEAYGGSGNGTTDNSAAWSSALAAIGTSNGCIQLGSGTYKSTTAVNISLSSTTSQSISITGAGPRTTVLYFPNATDGIVVAMPVPTNGLNIVGMTIATGQIGGRGGLVINSPCFGTAPGVANFGTGPQRLIDNVDFRGFDSLGSSTGLGAQYWGWGLIINNASFFNMRSITAYGPEFAVPTGGTGILIQGSGDNCASAIFNVSQGNFQRLATGVMYGNAVQGVNITQSNFTDNVTDFACPPTSKQVVQLTLSGNQFDNGRVTGSTGSVVIGCPLSDVMIAGNLFYAEGAINNIILSGSSYRYAISGNNFVQQPINSQRGNAINALGTVTHGIISGNQFSDYSTGVLLGSGASYFSVQGNNYTGTTTPVANLGTNNIIGGGTP